MAVKRKVERLAQLDNGKVIRSAGTVGLFVLLSRLFGLVRDMSMAACFGTSLAMSAFVVAFTIPNLFRSLFGEGAMSSAFVPVFTETRAKEGDRRVWVFAGRMFAGLALLLASVVLFGVLVASGLLYVFPGSERLTLILVLLRIMLPYMFLICIAAFFSAMLNSLHRFALPATVPVVLNLVVILAVLGVCPRLPADGYSRIKAVAWAVIAGGAVQAIMQLPRLWRYGFRPSFIVDWRDSGVRRVLSLMGVAVIGVGVTQLNVLLDRFIAAFISQGSPSYLYFAERLIYFPLGIFATALGTVLLPAFSGHAAQARMDRMMDTLNRSIRHLMFVMVPASAGLMALAGPIVRLVYERGDFTPESTRMTMLALMFYAPGLIVFSLLKIFVPLFYARQDMKTPVRVGVICTILNIILSLILMWPLKHLGIALATVLAATVHVVLLVVVAQARMGSPGWLGIARAFLRMGAAAAVMAISAVAAHRWLYCVAGELGDLPRQITALLGSIAIAVLIYAAGAAVLRCPELREILSAVKERRRG